MSFQRIEQARALARENAWRFARPYTVVTYNGRHYVERGARWPHEVYWPKPHNAAAAYPDFQPQPTE